MPVLSRSQIRVRPGHGFLREGSGRSGGFPRSQVSLFPQLQLAAKHKSGKAGQGGNSGGQSGRSTPGMRQHFIERGDIRAIPFQILAKGGGVAWRPVVVMKGDGPNTRWRGPELKELLWDPDHAALAERKSKIAITNDLDAKLGQQRHGRGIKGVT